MALLVGFDVAVARAVHLLIDRPIEIYQTRLTLPDTQHCPSALATIATVPQSGGNPSESVHLPSQSISDQPVSAREGMDHHDQDNYGVDENGLTTRTGTGTKMHEKKLSQGQGLDGVGLGAEEEGGTQESSVDAIVAMKRRVLWDDCLGFLAHVALPGRVDRVLVPSTIPL